MRWFLTNHADRLAARMADRHYSRKKPGSPQFTPPGRKLVFRTEEYDALWVTSWPFAEFVKHAWPGAWLNCLFRNEGPNLSSELIREAVAATRHFWEPPSLGMITMIDTGKVRKKRDFGRCYLRAGFHRVGTTKGGLFAFQLLPSEMPEAEAPLGIHAQMML